MKKYICIIIAVILTAACFCACGAKEENNSSEGISVVTTIFPEYDWVMNVLGDNPSGAEVTMLLDKGVDLHSYQPSVEDVMKISSCDLFVYVGGESDAWVEDALQEAENKDMVVIDLLECLGDAAMEEEVVEGMQETGHEHEGEEHEHEETEYDEHVWLSLRNAEILVNAICEGISTIDPGNASVYADNTSAYIEKLDALDKEYETAAEEADIATLVFGDRFPFRYLTDDYGLSYYAAFPGCSAETEASFETIAFLAGKIDELGLTSVLTIDGSDQSIAQTIVQNTGSADQKILTLDSMQSVTSEDVLDGAGYISIMKDNLNVLKAALDLEE